MGGPQGKGVYDLYVKNIMVPNAKQWDVQVKNSLFDRTMAVEILKFPLLEDVLEDGLVWKEEQNGVYSVNYGYRLWRNVQANHCNSRIDGNWENI